MINKVEAFALLGCLAALAGSLAAFRGNPTVRRVLPTAPSPISRPTATRCSLELQPGKGSDLVVQALDYQCPPCHMQEASAEAFRKKHPSVEWRILEFPLAMHNHAERLALLAYAADAKQQFPAYHRAVSAALIQRSDEVNAFVARHYPATASLVKGDVRKDSSLTRRLQEAKKLPIESTPTFLAFRADGKTAELHSVQEVDEFFGGSQSATQASGKGCAAGEDCSP